MSPNKLPTHSIGIIQGRLVTQVGDRIQAFPLDEWELEFEIASQLGFGSIELTIEMDSWETHPVRSAEGRDRLRQLSQTNAIGLAGLCCDIIMEVSIVDVNPVVRADCEKMLEMLIVEAAMIGLPMLELPVMGKASLREEEDRMIFIEAIRRLLPIAEYAGIDILIESDLPPRDLVALMEVVDHPRFGINYDTGNSTWFGFDPRDEMPVLAPYIRNIHIKDCRADEYSVPLGTGETEFPEIFAWLKKINYRGGFILQAARQKDNIGAGREYLAFTHNFVRQLDNSVV
jgi:L-ribulose-5-phosphate 3-epimerase